jgi:hypothetical protein
VRIKPLLHAKKFKSGSTFKEDGNYSIPFTRLGESVMYGVEYGRLKINYTNAISVLPDYRRQMKQAGFVFKDSSNDGSDRPNIRLEKMEKYYLWRVDMTVESPNYFILTLERFVQGAGPPPAFTKGSPTIKELVYLLDADDTSVVRKGMRMKMYKGDFDGGGEGFEFTFTRYKIGTRDQEETLARRQNDSRRLEFTSYRPGDVQKYRAQILAAQFILKDSVIENKNNRIVYTYQKVESELCEKVIKLTNEPGYSFWLEISLTCGELKEIEIDM